MKKSILYALSLLVIAISFNSCKTSTTNTPGDKVVELYDALKNENFEEAAIMYVTNKGEKLSANESKFLEGMFAMASENFKKKDGLEKVVIEEETIKDDGKSAKVSFTMYYNNGDTDKEKVTIHKFDGEWVFKVTNF